MSSFHDDGYRADKETKHPDALFGVEVYHFDVFAKTLDSPDAPIETVLSFLEHQSS